MSRAWSEAAWLIDPGTSLHLYSDKLSSIDTWEHKGVLVYICGDEIHVEDKSVWTPEHELPEPIVLIVNGGHIIYKEIEIITYQPTTGLYAVVKLAKDNEGKSGFYGISGFGGSKDGGDRGITEVLLRGFARWLECLRDVDGVFPRDYEFPEFNISDSQKNPRPDVNDSGISLLGATGRLYF